MQYYKFITIIFQTIKQNKIQKHERLPKRSVIIITQNKSFCLQIVIL